MGLVTIEFDIDDIKTPGEMYVKIGEKVHNAFVGNKDYIDSNIVINTDPITIGIKEVPSTYIGIGVNDLNDTSKDEIKEKLCNLVDMIFPTIESDSNNEETKIIALKYKCDPSDISRIIGKEIYYKSKYFGKITSVNRDGVLIAITSHTLELHKARRFEYIMRNINPNERIVLEDCGDHFIIKYL